MHTDTHTDTQTRTRRRLLGASVLVASVVAAYIATPLGAQSRSTTRPNGDYSVVGGMTLGAHANVIYVLDSANRELVALRWNDSTKSLEGVGYRDLVSDLTGETER